MISIYGEKAIKEEPNDKMFTYYHDGVTPDKDTIGNLIKKYCTKSDMFASSEW